MTTLVHVTYLGSVPIQQEEGVPPNDADCVDAIKFLRRPWRSNCMMCMCYVFSKSPYSFKRAASYRHGIPEEAQISVEDDGSVLKFSARSFPASGSQEKPVKVEVSESYSVGFGAGQQVV